MRFPSRPWSVLAPCVAAFALAGCLKTKDEAKLDAKGGGSLVQTYEVDVAMAKQVKDTLAMFGSSTFGPGAGGAAGPTPSTDEMIPDLFSEASARALAKDVPGFTLASVRDETKEGRRSVEVKAAFTSLEAAAKAGRFMNASVELAKDKDGSYTLSFGHAGIESYVDMVKSQSADGTIPGFPKGTDLTAFTGMLEGYFGGLSSTRSVTFPVAVGETNGTKSEDGKTVTWTAGFSELMGKGAVHSATFPGDGLSLTPFRHTPNYGEMYRRMRDAAKPAASAPPTPAPPAPPPTTPPSGPDAPPPPGMG